MAETQALSAAPKVTDKGFEHWFNEPVTDIESIDEYTEAIPGIAPPPVAEKPDPDPTDPEE